MACPAVCKSSQRFLGNFIGQFLVQYRRHTQNTYKSPRDGLEKEHIGEVLERKKRVVLGWLYDLATAKRDTVDLTLPLTRHYQFLCSCVGAVEGGVLGGILNTPRAIATGRPRDLYHFYRDFVAAGLWKR